MMYYYRNFLLTIFIKHVQSEIQKCYTNFALYLAFCTLTLELEIGILIRSHGSEASKAGITKH